MEKETRNEIKKMVQAARNLLVQEIQEQLEGVYGLRKDGTIEASLPQLKEDSKALRAREGFEYFIHNERSQGVTEEDSVKTLVLNLSFTHLNRLIALKLMERRKVIRESISRKTNSNGFKFFLADSPGEEERFRCGQVDEAYKNFILHQYGRISKEIHVLFDPEHISNLVFPRPRAFYELLDMINQETLAEIWEEDETIGWIYQYFTPKELREKARKESAAPRNSYELAFRNQFYTPRYVVKFLTDNTLGRTWYEMRRGDTKLADVCEYMVRRPNEVFLEEGEEPPETAEDASKTQEELLKEPFYIPYRAKKDPREIRILDPAVGSGHFLLYCFDLLQSIYEEAYDDPDIGHPLKKEYPSLEEYGKSIPGLILRHNLHGIDIDLRATQIASLALWLRAQRAYQEIGLKADERPKITKSNIACAEPMPGDENILEAFKKNLGDAVLGELVSDVWKEMKLAGEAGSLLKIEERIPEVVKEAKEEWLTRPTTAQLDLSGKKMISEQLRFDFSGIEGEMFWDEAEERLLEALERFAEEVSNGGAYSRRLFADDAAQGFAFIDVMRKKYDVVLMNPPFGAATKKIENVFYEWYPEWNFNLLCSFGERALKLTDGMGCVGAITDRTYMLKTSYKNYRLNTLLKSNRLAFIVDLGWEVLDANVEVNLQVFYPYSKEISFLNVVHTKAKSQFILKTIGNFGLWKTIDRDFFLDLPDYILSYDLPLWELKALSKGKPIPTIFAIAKSGLKPGRVAQFVRLHWEVISEKGYKKTWNYFQNGGPYSPYYYSTDYVIYYEQSWTKIKSIFSSRITGLDDYWKPGLTYGERTDYIYGYPMPSGQIFSNEGMAVFPIKRDYFWNTLSFLNSFSCQKLINLLAGQHKLHSYFNKIYLFPDWISRFPGKNAQEIFKLIRLVDQLNETSMNFITPNKDTFNIRLIDFCNQNNMFIKSTLSKSKKGAEDINNLIAEIVNDETFLVSGDNSYKWPSFDRILFGEKISNTLQIGNLLQYCIGAVFGRWDLRMALDPPLAPELADPFDPLPVCPPGMLVGHDGLPASKGQIVSEEWLRARENVLDIPENILNPTIPDDKYPLKIDWDGILVDDPGHEDDIIRRVRDVLELIWGDRAPEIENEACEILKVKSLRDYFQKKFFGFHIKRYSKSRRKAPIYWQLATRNKNYSLWFYYHGFTSDTLFLALQNYVSPKVNSETENLREMKDKLESEKESLPRSQITKLEKEIEKQADVLLEIKEFRETLEKIAQSGYNPDFDDGVILNMAPLHELIPWNEPAKYWKDLEAGKYDWAHIAMKYWRERVEEKCNKDKSLAIAHGLEELYDGNSN